MPKKQQKMASNQKMQENKSTLKFNFTQDYMWPVLILGIFCSDGQNQRALVYMSSAGGNGNSWWHLQNSSRTSSSVTIFLLLAKVPRRIIYNVCFTAHKFATFLINIVCLLIAGKGTICMLQENTFKSCSCLLCIKSGGEVSTFELAEWELSGGVFIWNCCLWQGGGLWCIGLFQYLENRKVPKKI